MRNATDGLTSFELKPDGLSRDDLFRHMIKHRKRASNTQFQPSEYLDVEMKDIQKAILTPSAYDLAASRVLENAGGKGARMKIAERRLNATGEVQSYCCLTNTDERLRRLENASILECSLAEISRLDQAEKQKKAEAENEEHEKKLPDALRKYILVGRKVEYSSGKGGLSCPQIRAIASCIYSTNIPKTKKKKEQTAVLRRLIEKCPSKMTAAEAQASPAAATAAADSESEEEEDLEESSEEEKADEEDPCREEWYNMRVAHRHVEDQNRICFGTVETSGKRKGSNVIHWRVIFDEDDAVIPLDGSVSEDNAEDFKLQEMEMMFELYEDKKDNDPNPGKSTAE